MGSFCFWVKNNLSSTLHPEKEKKTKRPIQSKPFIHNGILSEIYASAKVAQRLLE